MPVRVWLDLPRDARWVASVRDVAASLLQTAGTPDADVADVQLALTEACANVVRHAVGTDSYTVGLAIDAAGCEVEIVDHGPGFEEVAADGSVDAAETGRGLDLMRALVDDLEVRTDTDTATTRVVLRQRSSAGLAPAMAATVDVDAATVSPAELAVGDPAHPADARGRSDVPQRIRRSRPFRPGESDPAWSSRRVDAVGSQRRGRDSRHRPERGVPHLRGQRSELGPPPRMGAGG